MLVGSHGQMITITEVEKGFIIEVATPSARPVVKVFEAISAGEMFEELARKLGVYNVVYQTEGGDVPQKAKELTEDSV